MKRAALPAAVIADAERLLRSLEKDPIFSAELVHVHGLLNALRADADPLHASYLVLDLVGKLDQMSLRANTDNSYDAVVRRTLDIHGAFAEILGNARELASLLAAELQQLSGKVVVAADGSVEDEPALAEARPAWLPHLLVWLAVRIFPTESRAETYKEYLTYFPELDGRRQRFQAASRMLWSAWPTRQALLDAEKRAATRVRG
jgi:hypothetical protein